MKNEKGNLKEKLDLARLKISGAIGRLATRIGRHDVGKQPNVTGEDAELIQFIMNSPRPQEATFLPHGALRDVQEKMVTKINPREIGHGDPILLPTTSFVSAPGLEDWLGTGRFKGDNAEPSSKVIARHARKPGNTMPPLGMTAVYVQPNGMIFAQLLNDGAHRLAAAQHRRDEFVPVAGEINVYQLDRDILPLPEQTAKA